MRKNAIPFFIIIFSLSFLGIFTNQSYLNNINHYLINSKEDYKASFTTVFTNNGSAICTAEDIQYVPRVCSDGTGGAIICWIDNRDTPVAIYAQRIVSNGTVLWGSNGKPICTLDDTLYYQESMKKDSYKVRVLYK